MDALDQSDALMRRSDKLRAQSVRNRANADEKLAKSRRLIAAAHEAVTRTHGDEPTGPRGRATADHLPAGR
jgi:hypothetical protein